MNRQPIYYAIKSDKITHMTDLNKGSFPNKIRLRYISKKEGDPTESTSPIEYENIKYPYYIKIYGPNGVYPYLINKQSNISGPYSDLYALTNIATEDVDKYPSISLFMYSKNGYHVCKVNSLGNNSASIFNSEYMPWCFDSAGRKIRQDQIAVILSYTTKESYIISTSEINSVIMYRVGNKEQTSNTYNFSTVSSTIVSNKMMLNNIAKNSDEIGLYSLNGIASVLSSYYRNNKISSSANVLIEEQGKKFDYMLNNQNEPYNSVYSENKPDVSYRMRLLNNIHPPQITSIRSGEGYFPIDGSQDIFSYMDSLKFDVFIYENNSTLGIKVPLYDYYVDRRNNLNCIVLNSSSGLGNTFNTLEAYYPQYSIEKTIKNSYSSAVSQNISFNKSLIESILYTQRFKYNMNQASVIIFYDKKFLDGGYIDNSTSLISNISLNNIDIIIDDIEYLSGTGPSSVNDFSLLSIKSDVSNAKKINSVLNDNMTILSDPYLVTYNSYSETQMSKPLYLVNNSIEYLRMYNDEPFIITEGNMYRVNNLPFQQMGILSNGQYSNSSINSLIESITDGSILSNRFNNATSVLHYKQMSDIRLNKLYAIYQAVNSNEMSFMSSRKNVEIKGEFVVIKVDGVSPNVGNDLYLNAIFHDKENISNVSSLSLNRIYYLAFKKIGTSYYYIIDKEYIESSNLLNMSSSTNRRFVIFVPINKHDDINMNTDPISVSILYPNSII